MEGKAEENNISAGQQLLKKFPKTGGKKIVLVLGSLVVVLAGIGTGWLISGRPMGDGNGALSEAASGVEQSQGEAGIADEETFRDSAEGILEEGGIDGEGTHRLIREGGPSKYAYLTSTVIDLQPFVGKTVKVWGETISARSAGWLMDVGKIKVLE